MDNKDLRIERAANVDAVVRVPGSKSYTNRALVIAALAKGTTTLKNALMSDDTTHMMRALEKLGLWMQHDESSQTLTVIGSDGHFPGYVGEIYIQNAGTAMRFLVSMLTLGQGTYFISGNERMLKRPIGDLVRALRSMGVNVRAKDDEYPPVMIEGGHFPGGTVTLRGTDSSQYLSSLLLSAPYAEKPLTVAINGTLVSKPYIDMTIDLMEHFGASVKNNNYESFTVSNEKVYCAGEYTIESDASNASYFFAIPAVVGGRVRVENISYKSKQGDIKLVDIFETMGCTVTRGENFVEVSKSPDKKLKGVDVSLNDMPDVAQTLAVVALAAEGPTTIRGVENMRIKETNRIEAVANEIRMLGGGVTVFQDGFTVHPAPSYKGVRIATYDDHRMAMAFSLAGLFIDNVVISNPSCVRKTFPDYFSVFSTIYKK
ncbi:MAG: 3-phosphoshikimate 1-carboxyvinyltransferase [Spirochaetes bacterium]|nr:3-phosphoshikimate 1-carboxyvinyltransferase [Spirochaetota bacterium]